MKIARVPTASPLAALFAASLAVLAAPPASAQGAGGAASPASGASMTPAERHDWELSHRVGKMVGSEVHNKAGEKIGDIRDLVVDDHGRIVLAIVSTGGFLGLGDRLHAVPWDALSPGPKDDRILDIDKARLKAAPGFTSKTWPNLNDERWQADNRQHYLH